MQYRRLRLTFPQAAGYGFKAEVEGLDGRWLTLAEQPPGADVRREREIETAPLTGGAVRLTIKAPNGAPAGLAEVRLLGVMQDR